MDLQEKFRARFGSDPRLYSAPGRVNLIGEHTDYNEGLVMPAAIEFSCRVAAGERSDRKIAAYSENFDETAKGDLNAGLQPRRSWSDYPFGVAAIFEQDGLRLPGANLYISGDVPLGAGLSSSAAIEVAVALALADLAHASVDRTELARLCQRAENEFAGARCGIMDPFIACHAQAGHALMLDCRSLEFTPLPIPEGLRIVICNTMVRHAIAGGEYNARRAQCEEAARRLRRSLRDVSRIELEEQKERLDPILYKRARHIITENQRVLDAARALERGDLQRITNLMAESHASLRDDYEVSCRELDFMVEIAARQSGLCGARMTGGGFGGCTVNLVREAGCERFQTRVFEEYRAATGIGCEIYVSKASGAAQRTL